MQRHARSPYSRNGLRTALALLSQRKSDAGFLVSVVSITDAWTCRTGWNRNAAGAGAVLAVLEATGGRR